MRFADFHSASLNTGMVPVSRCFFRLLFTPVNFMSIFGDRASLSRKRRLFVGSIQSLREFYTMFIVTYVIILY